LHHAAGSHAEKKAAVDPIIQQLLKNARSEAVRQEFLSMPQGEYTSKHSIEVLVSVHGSALLWVAAVVLTMQCA